MNPSPALTVNRTDGKNLKKGKLVDEQNRRNDLRSKGQLVEKFIVYPLMIEVPIRLTKHDMLFRAEYGGKGFYSKDGEDIKRQVEAFVKASNTLKWTPYIAISLEESHFCVPGAVDINFGIGRFYIGKNDKILRKLEWNEWERLHENSEADKLSARLVTASRWTDIDPEVEASGGETYYRPYSKKLWKGLETLHKSLQEAKGKILQLITTEKGIARIEGGGKLALTSGETRNKGGP